MFFLIMVARVTSLSLYGSLSYALVLIAVLIGFSDLGLRDFFLSKEGLEKKYSKSIILLLCSSLVFIFIFLFQYLILEFNADLKKIYLLLIFEAFALGVFHKIIYYKYQSDNLLSIFSLYDFFIKMIPLAIKVILLYETKDLFLSISVAAILTFCLYFFWLCNLKIISFIDLGFYFFELKNVIRDIKCWGVYTISFVSFFLYFGADKLVVNYFLGIEQLAIYSAAMGFMAIGQIFVGVLWSLYMPRLSRGEIIFSYHKFIFIISSLSIVLVLVYYLFSTFFYHYIYPTEYQSGANVLKLASFYFIFRFPNVVMEIYYIVDGNYKFFVKMRVFCGFISLGISFVLLPFLGIIGAALSLVLSEMLLTIGSLLWRRRKSF